MSDGKITEQDIQEFTSAIRNFVISFGMYDETDQKTWGFREDVELAELRCKNMRLEAKLLESQRETASLKSKLMSISSISTVSKNPPYSGG